MKPHMKPKEPPSDPDEQQLAPDAAGDTQNGEQEEGKEGETVRASNDRSTGDSSASNSSGAKSVRGKTTTAQVSSGTSKESQTPQVIKKQSSEQDVAWREPLLEMLQ